MEQLRLPIFTSKIKIYNLRIVPPEPIFDKIVNLKKQFVTNYGKLPLSKSKPHITLAAFKMNSKYQDSLIKIFGQLGRIEKFKLNIEGFDIFENKSNTLHLKVSKTENIERIHQELQVLWEDNLGKKLKSVIISGVPHITISKTNTKNILYKSLEHFQKIGYSQQLEVDRLTLVSRSKHKAWDWEHQIKLS